MVLIKKASGEYQEFDPRKLYSSLNRVGASPAMANEIIKFVKVKLYKGITTKKIYSMALKRLRKMDVPAASRYKLKWAIMRLGQQGFSFEHFTGRLFERMGYKVRLNRVMKGKCITHEVDVAAQKGDDKLFVECKHKSKPGIVIDVQTALYVYARFLDLSNIFNRGMLLTNSKMSQQAIDYAECMGLGLMAWRYPPGKGLEKTVENLKIYPVTVLHTVTGETLKMCLRHDIVTVSELARHTPEMLASLLHVVAGKANAIINEAWEVLEKGKSEQA